MNRLRIFFLRNVGQVNEGYVFALVTERRIGLHEIDNNFLSMFEYNCTICIILYDTFE